VGSRSIFHRPSCSPSFFAAKSERRTCACQGLTSSRYAVVITPLCAVLVFAFDPSGTTVYPSIFAPNNERQVVRDDYFPKDVSLAARGAVPGALFTAVSPTFDSFLQVRVSSRVAYCGGLASWECVSHESQSRRAAYSTLEFCPLCSADQIVQEVILFQCFIRD
jgi:hypothetical protein